MGRKNAHPPKSVSDGAINRKVHVKEPKEKREKQEVKIEKRVPAVPLGKQAKEAKKEWRRCEVARLAAEATHQSQSLMKKSPGALFKLMSNAQAFEAIAAEDAHLAAIEKAKHLPEAEARALLASWDKETRPVRSISKHAVASLSAIWDARVQFSLAKAAELLACEGRPVHRQTLSKGKATMAVRIMSLQPRAKRAGELPYPQNVFAMQNAQCDLLGAVEKQREANRKLRAAQREAHESEQAAASAPSPDMSDLPAPKQKKDKNGVAPKNKKASASAGKPVPSSPKKVGKKSAK